MRCQETANATPEPSNAKRKASESDSWDPLVDAAADSDMPRPLPNPSKRPASAVEVEDGTEYQHTHKRARTEDEATTIEPGQVSGSDCISDASRSASPWPGIEDGQPQQVDPSEVLRRRREIEELRDVRNYILRWEEQCNLQCEAYRRFRLQRLPSPAPSDDDDFPHDPDTDQFGYTPYMLGLDHDDPRVEEVFGLAYTLQLERTGLRKPTHRPAVQAVPDGPSCIQHPLSSADDPKQEPTLEIDDKSSFGAGILSSKTSTTTTPPGQSSTSRITRQSLRQNSVFYELDRRTRARVVKP
ncbi:hypothetical protein F5X97DRAFT_309058 [Nemania serpens]|nr:hypothetical protein F5X97DRAFT_309058 [Nemania serpens]